MGTFLLNIAQSDDGVARKRRTKRTNYVNGWALFKHKASNFQELRASVCIIAFQMAHDRNNS